MIFTALTLFYKDNCNIAPNLNMFTVLSALKTLEYDLSFEIIFFLKLIEKKETYDGEPSGRRVMSFTNTFWHLRTVRNSFVQCFFKSICS